MTVALKIEEEFTHRSARVKSLDLHPSEPWILAGLHSGSVIILNYKSQTLEKSVEVTNDPVRSAKFVARKKWFITGSDKGFIHAYNYETMEKLKEVEAHSDFIRCLVVHPTLPYVLTASDDKLIKLWDWEKDWVCPNVFEGHGHYVMQVAFNPRNHEIFASASLDGTVKLWAFDSSFATATLNEHSKGVNCVGYLAGTDKLRLLTGSDDYTAKDQRIPTFAYGMQPLMSLRKV